MRAGKFAQKRWRLIRLSRSRTSKFRDRALPARAWRQDLYLHGRASPRKQSNLNRTSTRRRLPLLSEAMSLSAREKQISQRRDARDHSENFDHRNSAADIKFPESLSNPASASTPTRSKRKTPASKARSTISFSLLL